MPSRCDVLALEVLGILSLFDVGAPLTAQEAVVWAGTEFIKRLDG